MRDVKGIKLLKYKTRMAMLYFTGRITETGEVEVLQPSSGWIVVKRAPSVRYSLQHLHWWVLTTV
jgi:hypothetical protein